MRPYRSRIALLETDALRWTLPVHSDISLLVLLYYNGRTDRASLQESYCFAGDGRSFAGHPTLRYSSCCTTTDAQTERPYRSRIALLETDSLRWTLPVHSDISLLVSLYYDGRSDRASLQESYCFAGDGRPSLDTIVCPYISLLVLLYYNGRTDRASLQESYYSDTMDALLQNSIGVIGVDQKCRR